MVGFNWKVFWGVFYLPTRIGLRSFDISLRNPYYYFQNHKKNLFCRKNWCTEIKPIIRTNGCIFILPIATNQRAPIHMQALALSAQVKNDHFEAQKENCPSIQGVKPLNETVVRVRMRADILPEMATLII